MHTVNDGDHPMDGNAELLDAAGKGATWMHAWVCVVVVDRFYIALFSALEQTHCARMLFYMSE